MCSLVFVIAKQGMSKGEMVENFNQVEKVVKINVIALDGGVLDSLNFHEFTLILALDYTTVTGKAVCSLHFHFNCFVHDQVRHDL